LGKSSDFLTIFLHGFKIKIPNEVYPPSDDTFLVLDNLRVEDSDEVLEVGCGCGIITLTAAKKARKVVATDINPFAVKTTKENVKINGLEEKVQVRIGDLFNPIEKNEKFSLIIFNPPYLPTSGKDKIGGWLEKAWDGGVNGRRVIDRFLDEVKKFLKENGRILMVQSTLSNVEKTLQRMVTMGFYVKILGIKHLDFETLVCFEAYKQKE